VTDPLYITRNGHRTWLKWHRGRRTASDPVFTPTRILEAMRLGASVEVDLVIHADNGCAVLHNFSLEKETTGTGLVRETPAATLRDLHLRDNEGAPIADKVMLLEDLCALLAENGAHPEALLQLDFKENMAALTPEVVANFAHTVAPVAGSMILSGGDAQAIALLADTTPGLRRGFDPSDEEVFKTALSAGTLDTFVADAVAASPDADFIYLHWQIVTLSADAGFDIVEAFHRHGKRIDAWTINTVDDTTIPHVRRLLDLKVDQITTDDPERLKAAIDP
jgi:glycerophosphoryl diester phosphodiesterase